MRTRALVLPLTLALGCAGACGSSDQATSPSSKPDASVDASSDAQHVDAAPDAAPDAATTDAAEADAPELDASDADADPPCEAEPCAARPIIFVHGFQGSWDDFVTMLENLVVYDGRWDSFTVSGNDDALAWAPKSFARRRWLFGFDYYLKKAADGRGSYTAGPGRIGSNIAYVCASPAGKGHIIGDDAGYDQDVNHEYAQDLANFVERVRTATGAKHVDLVGHSMGGMVVRSYLAHYGGASITDRVMLLSSPVRGVSLIGFLQLFPVSGPSWMAMHEVAELDGGSILSKVNFWRCGDAANDKGAFGQKMLDEEQASPPQTELYVMSGGSDIEVSYATADHPLEKWHEVVAGASHSGILSADQTRQRVSQTLGGSY